MKVVVAFGDSNTYGYDPATGGRFAPNVRWTGVAQRVLGAGYRVIEEGLGGRTTVYDDPVEPHRRGLDYLPPCLMSHAPIDAVVISLGINDTKARFSASPGDIASGAGRLIEVVLRSATGPGGSAPKVLLVAPPPTTKLAFFGEMFAGSAEKSRALGARYEALARLTGVGFLDAGTVIRCSDLDGIHYEAAEHETLGTAIAETVRRLLGN